jgi:hypothetical protein
VRRHASTRLIPAEALIADRSAMAGLPPVAPMTGTTVSTRVGRDYYVAITSSSYSVHPEAIGRMITVTASLERFRAHCDDRLLADHDGSGVHTDWHPILHTSVRRRDCGNSICTVEHHQVVTCRSTSKSPT